MKVKIHPHFKGKPRFLYLSPFFEKEVFLLGLDGTEAEDAAKAASETGGRVREGVRGGMAMGILSQAQFQTNIGEHIGWRVGSGRR